MKYFISFLVAAWVPMILLDWYGHKSAAIVYFLAFLLGAMFQGFSDYRFWRRYQSELNNLIDTSLKKSNWMRRVK
jgi:hypothetical protein